MSHNLLFLLLFLVLAPSRVNWAFEESAKLLHKSFLRNVDPQKSSADLDEIKRLEAEADKLTKERKYDLASGLLLRALEIRQQVYGPQSLEVATALNDLGGLSYQAGAYDRGIDFLTRGLGIRERVLKPDDLLIAESLSDLAAIYVVKGDLITPEPMIQRALSIQEKATGSESLEVAVTLNTLATLYENRGDRNRAEPLFKRSLAIREKKLGEQHPVVAVSLNNLGRLYMANRDFTQAEELYKRSLKIRETVLGPRSPDLAAPIINLATLYYEQGRFDEAEPLFQRALNLQERAFGQKHPALVNTLNNLAEVYRHKQEFQLAQSLYQRTLDVSLQTLGPDHSAVASALRGFALLEEARGDARAAVSFLQRCNNIRERNLSLILTSGSESQKLLYMATLTEETDLTVSLHLQNTPESIPAARLALTTILQRKGRVLDVISSSVEALRRRAAPQDLALIDQLAQARGQLAKLTLSAPSQSVASVQKEISELEKKVEQLEAEISSRSSQFRAQSQPVALDRVQRVVPNDAALVEFVTYRPFDVTGRTGAESFGPETYAAYILSSSGEPAWVKLPETKTVSQAIKRFRKSLTSPSTTAYRKDARALDDLLMRPVRKFIGTKKKLFLSPDGDLNLIPFGALIDERNRFLVQTYTISYLSSGRDLLRLQVKAPSREAPVVVANPQFGDAIAASSPEKITDANARSLDFRKLKLAPLPGTAKEAEALKILFPSARSFTGIEATEAVVKKVAGPSLLHIATHGFFLPDQENAESGTRQLMIASTPPTTLNENPLLRSGLVLAGVSKGLSGKDQDGVLTALEAADLDLWGTQMVALSACDTGLGDVRNGEGVYGLRRALVLAGAESQVMSLWKVSDSATRDLMIAYYRLLKAGEGRTEALRQVQLEMIQGRSSAGKRFSHPFYWASFIQSGEWRKL